MPDKLESATDDDSNDDRVCGFQHNSEDEDLDSDYSQTQRFNEVDIDPRLYTIKHISDKQRTKFRSTESSTTSGRNTNITLSQSSELSDKIFEPLTETPRTGNRRLVYQDENGTPRVARPAGKLQRKLGYDDNRG